LAYIPGNTVIVTQTEYPETYFHARVQSYNKYTGVIILDNINIKRFKVFIYKIHLRWTKITGLMIMFIVF
jgi:hypothetical protein